MTDDRRVDGIDVSHYQQGPNGKRPDWRAVLTDPRIRFVAVKATQGVSMVDSEFRANWADLRQLVPHPCGKPGAPWLAVYHFRTNDDTVAQASHFKATVGALRDGEGCVLDCEGATAGSYGDQRALCEIAGRMFDRVAIRYGNDTAWSFDPYVKWCARYRPSKPAYPCSLWQFGSALVPGIVGEVDANKIMDEAGLARAFHSAKQSPPADEDVMTPAQEAKLDKVLKLLDDYFGIDANGAKDIRKKIDAVYVEVADENHADTLGGRVKKLADK